jgi:predicted translin family RNA/ssDNA-binding protein
MDPLINLLNWCKQERESLQMQREMLRSGKFRIYKDEGSGQVDATPESIERITANMAELDRLLADYDARSSHAAGGRKD